MAVLRVDLEQLNATISDYETSITEFEESIKNVDNALESLKASGWKSNASTAYFLHYEDTWKKNMKKQVKILKHLKECLANAKKEYAEIYNQYNDLKKSLN